MKREITIIGNLLYFNNMISPINSLEEESHKLIKELINSCKIYIGYSEYRFIKMDLNDEFIVMYFPKNNVIKKEHKKFIESKNVLEKLDSFIENTKNN